MMVTVLTSSSNHSRIFLNVYFSEKINPMKQACLFAKLVSLRFIPGIFSVSLPNLENFKTSHMIWMRKGFIVIISGKMITK